MKTEQDYLSMEISSTVSLSEIYDSFIRSEIEETKKEFDLEEITNFSLEHWVEIKKCTDYTSEISVDWGDGNFEIYPFSSIDSVRHSYADGRIYDAEINMSSNYACFINGSLICSSYTPMHCLVFGIKQFINESHLIQNKVPFNR